MAAPTFTSPVISINKTNIGPGLNETLIATSFSEGQTTLLVDIGAGTNVVRATLAPVTAAYTTGTTGDSFVCVNTINSSGIYTLIANGTTASQALWPSILKFARNGTNNQDCIIEVKARG